MIEFLAYLISELILWSIVKPIGVTYHWVRSGFKRSWPEIWVNQPFYYSGAGAFIVLGVIAAVGIVKIIRDVSA